MGDWYSEHLVTSPLVTETSSYQTFTGLLTQRNPLPFLQLLLMVHRCLVFVHTIPNYHSVTWFFVCYVFRSPIEYQTCTVTECLVYLDPEILKYIVKENCWLTVCRIGADFFWAFDLTRLRSWTFEALVPTTEVLNSAL